MAARWESTRGGLTAIRLPWDRPCRHRRLWPYPDRWRFAGYGKNYIVESFLVVVTGGVGELAGTLYAGMGLGVLNKIFEPLFGAVWGQVLVLIAIMLFLQTRPVGLFPPKGRHADV